MNERVEGPRVYMFHLLWMARVRIWFQHTWNMSHTSYRLFRLWNQGHLMSSKVLRGHFKVFLKGLEGESYKTTLDLMNHRQRIFVRPRDGHIAVTLVVWLRLESKLLILNSSFVANLQRLKVQRVIIIIHQLWVIWYDSCQMLTDTARRINDEFIINISLGTLVLQFFKFNIHDGIPANCKNICYSVKQLFLLLWCCWNWVLVLHS